MDRIDAMQAFARVVETGSFTRAADSLQTSRTRVTQLVQQLEAHLRVKLLNRSTRKVSATADGEAFYERVLRLLADLDDAETSLSVASQVPRGRLRVDVPAPLACRVVAPALPRFHAMYPDIQLDLGASDRRIDLIEENVDCVLRGGEPTEPSMRARHVADLLFGVYAAPGYLAQAGTPKSPQAIDEDGHVVIGYRGARSRTPIVQTLHRGGEQVRLGGRRRLAVDDGNAYLAAGTGGAGILALPRYMARAPLARGELVPLFEDWTLASMPLYIVYPPGSHVSPKLRAFIDWIIETLARHAPDIRTLR